jgi:hypothetical protein
MPPLRPALAASSGSFEKLRSLGGTLCPPLLAIARCFAGSIDAKPRLDVLPWFAMCSTSVS